MKVLTMQRWRLTAAFEVPAFSVPPSGFGAGCTRRGEARSGSGPTRTALSLVRYYRKCVEGIRGGPMRAIYRAWDSSPEGGR